MEMAPANLRRITFLRILGSLKLIRKFGGPSKFASFLMGAVFLLIYSFCVEEEFLEVFHWPFLPQWLLPRGRGSDGGILPEADASISIIP